MPTPRNKAAAAKIMYEPYLVTFYNPTMSYNAASFSKSPSKPERLIGYLKEKDLEAYFDMNSDFEPYEDSDFLLAHTNEYVDAFFEGDESLCESNEISWTPDFALSVRYTNSSLFHAIDYACSNKRLITFSPTSGFHHASPSRGKDYCTFSGQVIASRKIYQKYQFSGCYLDLDGHYGNSIEDSRIFDPEVSLAIPEGFNINPNGSHRDYLFDLRKKLAFLKAAILNHTIHYVVVCHGADSHEWDDLGGQCTTTEWLQASTMIYEMLRDTSYELGSLIPIMLALFGGYREDDQRSVLSLHTADLVMCLNTLCKTTINYLLEVNPRK